MKIPFIQHTGIGLHITDRTIRWVELSRLRDRITVERVEWREVKSGNLRRALKALAMQVGPASPYVTANVDPAAVDTHVSDVPFIEDGEELAQWIDETVTGLLPAGANPDQYAVTHQLFGDPDEGQRCLFVVTLQKVIRERVELLESAGLKPLILTPGILEPGYAVMFDEEVSVGRSWLLSVFEDQSTLLHFRDGLLEQVHPLALSGEADLGEAMAEAESMVAAEQAYGGETQPQQIYLLTGTSTKTGPNKQEWETESQDRPGFRQLGPFAHFEFEREGLPPEAAVACGMALKQLYPTIDTLNLLGGEELRSAAEEIEKKDTLCMISGLAGVVGVLFLVLILIQWVLGSRVEQADAGVAQLEDKITAVSEARNRVVQLNENVTEGKRLMAERTFAGRLLETVGNALPEGLWLNELTVDATGGPGDTEVALYGFAWNDVLVAAFLEHFEVQTGSRNVRLVYSEQVNTREIYGDSPYSRQELVRFEVRVDLDQQEPYR